MSHTLHIIDAFRNRPFTGNPAAVCVLAAPAAEAWMKPIALGILHLPLPKLKQLKLKRVSKP